MALSKDLTWMILRNNHSFIIKKNNIKKPFSTEPGNLKSIHSPRYSGIVPDKVIRVTVPKSGKGIVLKTKKTKNAANPVKSYKQYTFKKEEKKALRGVRNIIHSRRYRRDLAMATLRKVSAIYRAQNFGKKTRKQKVRATKQEEKSK